MIGFILVNDKINLISNEGNTFFAEERDKEKEKRDKNEDGEKSDKRVPSLISFSWQLL